jgi:hypothetical protein
VDPEVADRRAGRLARVCSSRRLRVAVVTSLVLDGAERQGLRSGTLYPVLIRWADRGLVEARWEDEQPAGRPRQHLYRLNPDGLAAGRAALTEAASQRHRPAIAPRRRPVRAHDG